jgi:hypothetical protein
MSVRMSGSVVIFRGQKGYAYKTVLETLIQMISHSVRKIGGSTIMLEPNIRVAGLFSSRSTDADFRRFRPSVPNLKLLPLDPFDQLWKTFCYTPCSNIETNEKIPLRYMRNFCLRVFMRTKNRNSDSCWPCYLSIFWRRSWSVWFLWQKRACLLSVKVPGDVRVVLLLLHEHGVLVWRDRTSLVEYRVSCVPLITAKQQTRSGWQHFGILCRTSSFVCLCSLNQRMRLALANSLFAVVSFFFSFHSRRNSGRTKFSKCFSYQYDQNLFCLPICYLKTLTL